MGQLGRFCVMAHAKICQPLREQSYISTVYAAGLLDVKACQVQFG